jgi:hypothetical protein
MSQSYEDPSGAFSLTQPDDWDRALQKSTIAFFQPKTGVGAVNVSAMVPTKAGVDPAELALEFTPESIRAGVRAMALESPVPGAYVEYEFKGDAWRVWAFRGQTRLLLVSYNCELSRKGSEDGVVDAIVQSLTVG